MLTKNVINVIVQIIKGSNNRKAQGHYAHSYCTIVSQ